FRQRTIQAYST
ncbi:carbohydrate phosphorylase family protein, partial [Chlamydia psittaci 06-1683]